MNNRLIATLCAALLWVSGAAAQDAPQVFLDKNPRIVAYQLKRLTNEQLLAIERKTDDAKYRPVFEAILSRKGIVREVRLEAADGLVKLNRSNLVTELLSSIARTEAEDHATRHELAGIVMLQPTGELAASKEKIQQYVDTTQDAGARGVAYAALVVAEGAVKPVWERAGKSPEHPISLINGLPLIKDPRLRAEFYPFVWPTVEKGDWNDPLTVAMVTVLCSIPTHEAGIFAHLSDMAVTEQGPVWEAAVKSIRQIPTQHWSVEKAEHLAAALIKRLEQTPAEQRDTPAMVEAIQLGSDLASILPAEKAAPVRKALRDLGVQVVLLRTLKEQMLYDLKYFVVQAGKPVKVVLDNTDVMPHNLVVIEPGSLTEVGIAAASLTQPTDPNVKAYVPDSPKVLYATHMLNPGEAGSLGFNAPTKPGEYIYVCTFPGHFVRMYGVMLVVPDIEAYEKTPQAPNDPLTGKPYDSTKHAPTDPAGHEGHNH